jgi:hypothetical protein
MSLSRRTRDELWRTLLAQSAAPRDPRPSHWIVPVTLLLTVLGLYVFTQI